MSLNAKKSNAWPGAPGRFSSNLSDPDDHWLPPDHFQESPRGNVAHYTTPTNIGLYLLSTLSAHDLGYIDLLELAVRLRSTFENMDKLEHYRGHLLNWYDTQTLAALPPRYISTVDSGNLAACLIALNQGLLALTDAPILGKQQWQGLLVILDILKNYIASTRTRIKKDNPSSAVEPFDVEIDNIQLRVTEIQDKPEAWTKILTWLSGEGWEIVSHRLMELLESHPNLNPETLSELQLYLDTLHHHLANHAAQYRVVCTLARVAWTGRLSCLRKIQTRKPGRILETACPTSCQHWGKLHLSMTGSRLPCVISSCNCKTRRLVTGV